MKNEQLLSTIGINSLKPSIGTKKPAQKMQAFLDN
ncbi:hypothetical protein VIRA109638_13615 [Vibrio rarus]